VAYSESNPTATGAAPDGNKQNLPVTIAGLPELGRHRFPAAGQTPTRVGFQRRKNWLGSTLAHLCWLLFCSPHIYPGFLTTQCLFPGGRKGGASAPPKSRVPSLWSSRAPRNSSRGTARGARRRNNYERRVTAGLKPRPSSSVVRNSGQITARPQPAQGLYRPPERALSKQRWLRASSRRTVCAR
jgi:hypothetical protein